MNQLVEQMQQAHESEGFEGAQRTFLAMVEQRDWTKDELNEAVDLLRSFPKA